MLNRYSYFIIKPSMYCQSLESITAVMFRNGKIEDLKAPHNYNARNLAVSKRVYLHIKKQIIGKPLNTFEVFLLSS